MTACAPRGRVSLIDRRPRPRCSSCILTLSDRLCTVRRFPSRNLNAQCSSCSQHPPTRPSRPRDHRRRHPRSPAQRRLLAPAYLILLLSPPVPSTHTPCDIATFPQAPPLHTRSTPRILAPQPTADPPQPLLPRQPPTIVPASPDRSRVRVPLPRPAWTSSTACAPHPASSCSDDPSVAHPHPSLSTRATSAPPQWHSSRTHPPP